MACPCRAVVAAGWALVLPYPAIAGEIRVPQDYPDVAKAVEAASAADVVRLDAGTFDWDPGAAGRTFPTILGAGAGSVLRLAQALRVTGTAKLGSLTLDAPNGALFADGGLVTVDDVEAVHGGTIFGRDGRAVVRGLRVDGAVSDRAVIAGSFLSIEAAEVVVIDSELPGFVSVDGPAARFRFSGIRVESSTLRQAAIWVRGPSVDLTSSVFLCVQSEAPVVVAERGALRGVIVWNWRSDSSTLFEIGRVSSASYLTLGSKPGDFVFRSAFVDDLADSFFAGSMVMSSLPGRSSRIRHVAGTVGALDQSIEVEPRFWGQSQVDSCEGLTLFPDRGSPLLDAGDPSFRDRDGSPSDIGAGGGPDGVNLVADNDNDRCPATEDCDDQAANRRPGNDETWYDGVDGDCDGADDFDQDRDGFRLGAGGDCDDLRMDVHPDAPDPCADGLDADCDGFDGADCDLDGFVSIAQGGDDCDDGNADVFPGAEEDVGTVDRDCDGLRDPTSPLEPLTCTVGPRPALATAWLLAFGTLFVGAAMRARVHPPS